MNPPDANGTGAAPATVTALAHHARRALAATGGGTLLINGLHADPGHAPDGEIEVLLYDEGGEPRFLCEAGSAVARAAERRRDAVLDLGCCRRSGCRREVSFAGQLILLDTDDVEGMVVHVVGLALSAVTVRQPGVAGVELPLASYRGSTTATAVDDAAADTAALGDSGRQGRPSTEHGAGSTTPGSESLAAYAERVVRHTNDSHAEALRCAAAELAGCVPGLVIAAEISDLNDQGFLVHWVGADGAHSCPLSFPRVARSPGDLAVLLRAALTST